MSRGRRPAGRRADKKSAAAPMGFRAAALSFVLSHERVALTYFFLSIILCRICRSKRRSAEITFSILRAPIIFRLFW